MSQAPTAQIGEAFGRRVAAFWRNGRAEDLLIETEGVAIGAVYRGRVSRMLAPKGGDKPGAFLEVGGETLFLSDASGLAPGDVVAAQVSKLGVDGKAPSATRRIEISGAFATCTPGAPGVNISRKIENAEARATLLAAVRAVADGFGFVLRTRAASAPLDAVTEEVRRLASRAAALSDGSALGRIAPAPDLSARAEAQWGVAATPAGPAESARLEAVIRQALSPTLALASDGGGAWMALTRAPGAVVIDVNAGSSRSAEAVNLAAASAIPRALRLRGWGGAVVIDFIGDDDMSRRKIEGALRRAADRDWRIGGWSPIGLFEAVLRADRAPLETIFAPAVVFDGAPTEREGSP